METAILWRDTYVSTRSRMILTREQHHIPGVEALAHHLILDSIPSLGWHYHPNTFEFSLSTKGSVSFSTRGSDYKFSGGDIFVSFPGEIHSTSHSPISPSDLYWFQLNISNPKKFLFMNEAAAVKMIGQLRSLPHHVVQADARQVQPLLIRAFDMAAKNEEPEFIAAYLQLFLHFLIASANREKFLLSPDIGRTLNFILDNLSSDLTLEELAAIANLSCSQYKQKFKQQLGVSPRHYINQQKIESAKDLLLEGLPVTETAMQLGFATSSYFSTVFKKYTSYTPLEYVKAQNGAGKTGTISAEKKKL